jgi:RNA polymerase sigma-70 factor (ECF subfamily)
MSSDRDDEEVVQLISSCQRSLLVYLLGLLGSQQLAEDALQDANVILWRKRREYRSRTNFFAWARQVAYLEACHLRKQRKRKVPVFSEVFMQEVSVDLEAAIQAPNKMEVFLKECLDLLSDHERELLDRRYADGATTRSVAIESKQSVRSIYRHLERIHGQLFDCINEKVKEDGAEA